MEDWKRAVKHLGSEVTPPRLKEGNARKVVRWSGGVGKSRSQVNSVKQRTD